jgi:predicted RNA methylase
LPFADQHVSQTENQRLDLQHNLMILTQDDRLFISPAGRDRPLNRVLDAGCGTGIWAIDFGMCAPGAPS